MTSRGFWEIWKVSVILGEGLWAPCLDVAAWGSVLGLEGVSQRGRGGCLIEEALMLNECQNGRLQLNAQVRCPKGAVPCVCPVSCAKLTSHIPPISDESRLNGRPDCTCGTARHVCPMPPPISTCSFA